MAIPAISQRHKIDMGVVPQAINNTDKTSAYYPMAGFRKALAIVLDGASAVNKATKIEWLQATDASGSGAKAVTQANVSSGTESSATSTKGADLLTQVTECTIALSNVAADAAITINDLTFTAHADTTTAATRKFAINGNDTADAAALAGLINDATYGVPGVTATADTGTITLKATVPGTTTITIADAGAGFTIAITQQVLYSEIDIDDMDIEDGFVYAAVKITREGTGSAAVAILREVGNYGPATQHVAAGTDI